MLLSKTVKQKWNSKNKKKYEDAGYIYTKMGDEFLMDVYDLPDSSNVDVEVQCDYCQCVYSKPWYRYVRENIKTTIHDDCCNNCKGKKIINTSMKKYGVRSVLSLDDVKDKVKSTNLERYGAENVFASKSIQQKIVEGNIEKYGVKSPMQVPSIQERASNTCFEKYGVHSIVELYCFSGEQNPRWKGGVEYHHQERATPEYLDWRTSVFHRDNYTCQCCGCRSGNGKTVEVNAHHIFNWKDNPDMRFDIDNGITLCASCHIAFHSAYGKSNNTKQQLDEFFYNYGKKIC